MNKKSLIIKFRISPEESEILRSKSYASGLSKSEFLRRLVVDSQINERISTDAVSSLSRIGNNLNQLARHANSTGEIKREASIILELIKSILLK